MHITGTTNTMINKLNLTCDFLLKVIVIFLIIVFFLLLQQRYGQTISYSPDAKLYYEISQAILKGSSQTHMGKDIGSVIMPGHSFIMASFFYIFGNNIKALIITQTIIAAFSIFIFYLILLKITNKDLITSFLLFILLLIYYPLWRNTFVTLKEIPTTIVNVGIVYLMFELFNKGKPKYAYWLYILFGVLVAIMNRYILHVFMFSLCMLIFLVVRKKYKEINIKHLVLSGFIFILILLPWHYRQYKVYDQIVLFSPKRTMNIKENKKTPSEIYKLKEKEAINDTLPELFKPYKEQRSNMLNSGFSGYRKKQVEKKFTPAIYKELINNYKNKTEIDVIVSKLKGFFTVYENNFRLGYGRDRRITPPASFANRIVNTCTFGLSFILLIPGIYFAIRKRNYFILGVTIFFFAHLFLHVYMQYLHRYRMTILPFLLVIAAYGFQNLVVLIKPSLQKNKAM